MRTVSPRGGLDKILDKNDDKLKKYDDLVLYEGFILPTEEMKDLFYPRENLHCPSFFNIYI